MERDDRPLPCGFHGPEAVCDRCPARYDTDGQGFPHPSVAHGRLRLRHCPRCGVLVSPEQWDASPTGRKPLPKLSPWQCLECTSEDAEDVSSGRAGTDPTPRDYGTPGAGRARRSPQP